MTLVMNWKQRLAVLWIYCLDVMKQYVHKLTCVAVGPKHGAFCNAAPVNLNDGCGCFARDIRRRNSLLWKLFDTTFCRLQLQRRHTRKKLFAMFGFKGALDNLSFYIQSSRRFWIKPIPKFSADSANAFSFYEVFCEQHHLQSVP